MNIDSALRKSNEMSQKPSVLITGASTGIGAAYAQRFAARGHNLILVARSTGKLEENAARLRADHGVTVDLLPADLTDEGQLAAVETRLREDAAIGILVNNAGGNVGGTFVTQNAQDLTKLVTLNATSVLRLSHAVAPRFTEQGEGAIINISSVLALAPEFGTSVYSATKAFVLSLSQALQSELGPKGVYVQAVLPAATRTEIWNFADPATLPPMMEVADLVDAALIGFDRREPVTIPPLQDAARWTALEAARGALLQNGSGSTVPGPRYRNA
ncbi:MAG TPA: SDR family oxidoreductase [Rhodopila sp.]